MKWKVTGHECPACMLESLGTDGRGAGCHSFPTVASSRLPSLVGSSWTNMLDKDKHPTPASISTKSVDGRRKSQYSRTTWCAPSGKHWEHSKGVRAQAGGDICKNTQDGGHQCAGENLIPTESAQPVRIFCSELVKNGEFSLCFLVDVVATFFLSTLIFRQAWHRLTGGRFRIDYCDLHPPVCSMFQEKFSMFASHSRWDGGEVRKLVPNAFSLTILR